MPQIDNLKTLINHKISDGRRKMSVAINENNRTSEDIILLFYNNNNDIYKQGRHVRTGYYSNGIQVVCRHSNYDKARTVAYSALEYISINRKNYKGVIFVSDGLPPTYTGRDDRTGGYTWSFDLFIKGGE